MSETTPPPPQIPTVEEINAAAVIDAEALKHWATIPDSALVVLNASRTDIDRLFLGLRLLAFSQGDHLAAFQQLSNGNSEAANASFASATSRHVQGLANITAFTSGIMAKAERQDG